MPSFLLLLPLVVLLLLSAFFSGTETAFFSLDAVQRNRIASAGPEGRKASRGRLVTGLLESRQNRLLSTILFGNTVVNVAASALAALFMEQLLPGESGLLLSMLLMTFLILVIGEIAPKTFAYGRSEAFALAVAPVVGGLVTLLKPVSWLLERVWWVARALHGGGRRRRRRATLACEELVSLVELGRMEGLLGAEAAVTASLLSLEDRQCREAMVPRSSVHAVRSEWSRERVEETLRNSPYSRLPVLSGPGESVTGYLNAGEVLLGTGSGEEPSELLLHEMLFFPENASLDSVMRRLRARGESLAAVVDEYGDWVGLVTLADILTLAVFKQLRREGELPEGVARRGEAFVVPASIRLEDLSGLLGVELHADYAESCGGLLEESTGRIPERGEKVVLQGCQFSVLGRERRSLGQIEVRLLTDSDREPDREGAPGERS
ncbi:HlyC/CorC family transporter [Candidatus Fermentibacterales bacterium]|nr:HlyC/CorC family transporter [Candidatus Fermentibacterales bacterium]